jgi:peroxiredoxin family protein
MRTEGSSSASGGDPPLCDALPHQEKIMNHDNNVRPIREQDDIARDIEHEIKRSVVPARTPIPLPDYVTHAEDVDQVGRLTAEAVAMSFEASAKKIEAMGAMLMDSMKECETESVRLLRELDKVKAENEEAVRACAAAAEVYRSQAKELFEKIQSRSIAAAKVRETCAAVIDDLK